MSIEKKRIRIIGIGPGSPDHITPAALNALNESDVIVGYSKYIELIKPVISGNNIFSTGMRGEKERIQKAIEFADSGKAVAVVSSGDSGIYGMAGLMLEMLDNEQIKKFDIKIIPGITAASAAASLAGAPLMHDFCVISLSDLLTDRILIEKRLRLAAEGDFVTVLYNPKSKKRIDLLQKSVSIFLEHRGKETPAAIVTDAYRNDEELLICSLWQLPDFFSEIGMTSVVIIGNSSSYKKGKWFVTPRGYKLT